MKSPALAPTEYDQTYQTELNTIISELDDNMMKLNVANFLIDQQEQLFCSLLTGLSINCQ